MLILLGQFYTKGPLWICYNFVEYVFNITKLQNLSCVASLTLKYVFEYLDFTFWAKGLPAPPQKDCHLKKKFWHLTSSKFFEKCPLKTLASGLWNIYFLVHLFYVRFNLKQLLPSYFTFSALVFSILLRTAILLLSTFSVTRGSSSLWISSLEIFSIWIQV